MQVLQEFGHPLHVLALQRFRRARRDHDVPKG
jgi:hypothetical protein